MWGREELALRYKVCGNGTWAHFMVGEHEEGETKSLRPAQLQVSIHPLKYWLFSSDSVSSPDPAGKSPFERMLVEDWFLSLAVTRVLTASSKSQPGGYGFKKAGLAFRLFYT